MLPSIAFAADTTAAAPSFAAAMTNLAPMVLIFVIFYFMLIRPQMKKQKQLQATINALKRNDEVVAAGGIVGKVVKLEDNYVTLEIAQDTTLKVLKSSITDVLNLKSNNNNHHKRNDETVEKKPYKPRYNNRHKNRSTPNENK